MNATLFRTWTSNDLRRRDQRVGFRGSVQLHKDGSLKVITFDPSCLPDAGSRTFDIVGTAETGETILARQCMVTRGHSDTGFTLDPLSCRIQSPNYDESAVTRKVAYLKNAHFRRSRHGNHHGSVQHGATTFVVHANRTEVTLGEFSAEIEITPPPREAGTRSAAPVRDRHRHRPKSRVGPAADSHRSARVIASA